METEVIESEYKTNVPQKDNEIFVGTDRTRWRLRVTEGRHCWYYLESDEELKSWPQTIVDKFHLGILTEKDVPTYKTPASTPLEAIEHGFEFYKLLQTEDGHWAGEYGGPLFLLPGLIISCYVTESLHFISTPQRAEIIKYLFGKQTETGGWGLHVECISTMFGTALNYCVLRILGVPPSHQVMVKARKWIKENGGAGGTPSWGKFWLSLLNVYDWEGLNPVPPELWLLPYAVPFHPGRYWCHTRQVYLPMGYCYGHRIKAKVTPLILELRQELYTDSEPYDKIQWYYQRSNVCKIDLYSPHALILEGLYGILHYYEKFHVGFVRKMALDTTLDLVKAEDDNTLCIGIGPVSKVINTVVAWHAEGPKSKWFLDHMDRIRDYLWISADGMMMTGTNGSQLWDTAFAAQALLETGLHQQANFRESVCNALKFFDITQLKRDVPNHEQVYRHISKGAFPFSTRDCGWIVADCTAEGLKAVIYFQDLDYAPKLISDERIFDNVNVLLSMQNNDGGFATYEKARGSSLLEVINPAEVFGNIMIDYSYVECTSAVIQGLNTFQKHYPDHRQEEISKCISRGLNFIRSIQREDGSWYGCWGVCFTYGTWFGIEGLAINGENYQNSEAQKKACDFLITKQKPDGGWGETFRSCEVGEYTENKVSQSVNTAWAIMGLMAASYPDQEPIRSGVKSLLSQQDSKGHWPKQSIMGVFNKSCAIDYPNYQNIFPLWALGRYVTLYGNESL